MENEFTRQFEFEVNEVRQRERTIVATASTETPVDRGGVYEILSHENNAIDFSRFPLPLVDNHKAMDMPAYGRATNPRIVNRKLKVDLVFGQSALAKERWQDVQDGTARHLSVGYIIKKKGRIRDDLTYTVTHWEPLELSIVPTPADINAIIGRSATNTTKREEKKISEAEMRRFEETKNFWKTGGGYTRLRDFFAAVKNTTELNIPDERLRALGLNEAVSSEGGFLLRPEFSRKLLEGPEVSPIWANCFKIPLGPISYSIKLPTWQDDDRQAASFLGGLRFFFDAEAEEIDQTNMRFAGLNMNLWKSTCLVPFTDELFSDAEGFEIIMQTGIQKALNFMLEEYLINGTGSGQPLGCLNAPCKIVVPKETQDANTINATNIENMILRFDPDHIYDYVWLASGTIQQELAKLNNEAGTGGIASPLFRYREGGQKYDQLAGRDILYSSHCQNLGTEGDLIAVNLKSGMICTYKEQKRTISMHVRFLNAEQMYRVIFRWNSQPAVAKAITPVKGDATVSPVITLQTRG